jgi:iron(III) transport system permease protein
MPQAQSSTLTALAAPDTPVGRRRWAAPDRTIALVIVLAIVLGLLTLPPLVSLVQGSLREVTPTGALGRFTFDNYRHLFDDKRFLESLVASFEFAIGSAALAICTGGLLAWLVERTTTPLKSFAHISAIISLGTPYILYFTAWLYLLGRAGPVNDLLKALLHSPRPVFNVYSMTGMILVEGFLWSPLAFLLLSSVFRSANADYEEAARICGASVMRTFTHVSLRLAFPALMAVVLLIVVRAIEAFEVPALVGLPGGVKVLTTDIYLDMNKTVPPDLGHSSAFSVALLSVAAALLYYYSKLLRNSARFHTVTGRSFRPRMFDLGKGRYVAAAIVLLNFLILLAIPTAALLWLSLMPYNQTISFAGLKAITWDNYRVVLHSAFYLELVWKTLLMGAGCATLVMMLSVLSGWLTVRRRPWAWLLDQLAMVPLVFPGIVLGVAVIQIYLVAPIPIYGTLWAFIIAFSIRYLPYGMRYATSGMLQIHPELEEAGTISGGSLRLVLRRIIVPLTQPAIVSGWRFIFLITARDVSLAVILASPAAEPVAVAMFDLWGNGQGTELAAFGLVWTAMMTVIVSGLYIIGRRLGSGAFGV